MRLVLGVNILLYFFSIPFACPTGWADCEMLGDSSIVLKDVLVESSRSKHETIGLQNIVLDSASLNRFQSPFFGDLLNQQNLLFVKTYGVGGLATPAFRGSSAEHTAVLWNGFNLQSPMNGTLDFSLLPPEFIGEAQVQPGSNASKWGSGSVGGTIQLLNPVRFGSGTRAGLQASIGSFNAYRQFAHFSTSQNKRYFSVKILNYKVLNNFPYKNTSLKEQPTDYQNNAGIEQQGILAEQSFLLPKNQAINLKYWYMNSERQLGSIIGVAESKASQQDWFHRIMADWQRHGKNVNWYLRSAYFDERILYKDFAYGIYSFSRSLSSVTEVENKITLHKNHALAFRINNTYSKAVSDGYPNFPEIHRIGGFVSYELLAFAEKLQANATIRNEWVAGKFIPIIPFVGLGYKLMPALELKYSFSRAYRLPTFNDLYWIPGGNSTLLPETGWAQEGGLHFQKQGVEANNLKWKFNSSLTIFSSLLQNRIIWQPTNAGYFSPQNMQEVWARGVEVKLKSVIDFQQLSLEISTNYDFTQSTAEKVERGQENQLGKQLIYIPIHRANATIAAIWKNYAISYNHGFKGYRYTVADNNTFLPSYQLGDVQVSKLFVRNQFSLKVFGQINNLWNEDYQVLPNRPMPQRNYLFGVAFQFYQPSKPLIK